MRMMLIKALPIDQDWGDTNKKFNSLFSVGTVFNTISKKEMERIARNNRDIFFLETKMNDEQAGITDIASPFPIYADELTCFKELK